MVKTVWIGCVNMTNLDKKLELLIRKEGLHQLDIFYKNYVDFEEMPLFSRFSHIALLSKFTFNEKNKILIKKCAELINTIKMEAINYLNESEIKDYFIGLTISDWKDYKEINFLSVKIFLSKRRSWILSNLNLVKKYSIEEHLVSKYLNALNFNYLDVFVTEKDNSEFKRVYVIKKFIPN